MQQQGVPATGLVWRLSMRWRAVIDRAMTPLGLTAAQYAVLAPMLGLERAGRQPSQRQLADFSGLEPLYVSKLARALERAGMLERAGDPDDTRAVRLALTDSGRDVVTQAVARVVALQDELLAPLGGPAGPKSIALIESLHLLLDSPTVTNRRNVMTESTSQLSPPLTGQDIGQAAQATRAVLERQLLSTGLGFEVWVSLNQVATSSDPLDADGLVARVVHGLKIDDVAARAAFATLVDQGLVSEGPLAGRTRPVITLTPAGTARFTQGRDTVGQITERLYGGVPAEDLAIAHRVLATVTGRANAELAS